MINIQTDLPAILNIYKQFQPLYTNQSVMQIISQPGPFNVNIAATLISNTMKKFRNTFKLDW